MEFLKIKNVFKEQFGGEPQLTRAPGRINLIGEHTDYNDGYVLPAAIDLEVIFAVAPNQSDVCRFYAIDLNQKFEIKLDYLQFSREGWPNYLMGVIDELKKLGHTIEGFDCVLGSDIPVGAGLSSSAAIECGMAASLNSLFDLGVSDLDIVKLSQRAENNFVGVNCGIMDQFASVFGKSDHVFRLDCRTLEYSYFPFRLADYHVLLIDTQVKHSLAASEYNTRRHECEAGIKEFSKRHTKVRSLRDVNPDMLYDLKPEMDEIIYRRCKYVVEEIERVTRACEDLQKGDLLTFGKRMYETHRGLSTEYEVSCDELDFLVDLAEQASAVIGARMMGGGFGGCTINLIRESEMEPFKEKIDAAYRKKFSKPPLFYSVSINDGVSVIE